MALMMTLSAGLRRPGYHIREALKARQQTVPNQKGKAGVGVFNSLAEFMFLPLTQRKHWF